jgi:epoxide hydrolase-like predicted phosphatase
MSKKLMDFIQLLKSKNVKVAVITNNWFSPNSTGNEEFWKSFKENFDVFIESRVVRMRKPDPRIYKLALEELKIKNGNEVVFLDDIGRNLKSASILGIQTILVKNEDQAITDLQNIMQMVQFQPSKL